MTNNPEPRPEDVELLPCPFCGDKPHVCRKDGYGGAQIFCGCSVEPCAAGEATEFDNLVAAWNTRAAIAAWNEREAK